MTPEGKAYLDSLFPSPQEQRRMRIAELDLQAACEDAQRKRLREAFMAALPKAPAAPPAANKKLQFGGVAYSGAYVGGGTAKPPLPTNYIIDLAGMTKADGEIVVNFDHDATKPVGHLVQVDIRPDRLLVLGILSIDSGYRDTIASTALSGRVDWQASIEANLWDSEFIDVGDTTTVNGRTISGRIRVFRRAEFTGLALVKNGADPENQIEFNVPKIAKPRPARAAMPVVNHSTLTEVAPGQWRCRLSFPLIVGA